MSRTHSLNKSIEGRYSSCTKVKLLLLLTAVICITALPRAGYTLDSDYQWRVSTGKGDITTLNYNNLINENHKGVVTYGSRKYGINLVWSNKPLYKTQVYLFENCTRPGDPIYGSDKIAIRVSRGPTNTGYLKYGARSNGVHLIWSKQRECEFRFISRPNLSFSATASTDGKFAIYNTSNKALLVYGKRKRGINLKWRSTAEPTVVEAKADLIPAGFHWIGNQAVLFIKNIGNVPTTRARNQLEISVNKRKFNVTIVEAIEPGQQKKFIRHLSDMQINECHPVSVQVDGKRNFQSGRGVFDNDLAQLQATVYKKDRVPRHQLECGPVHTKNFSKH